MEKTYAINLYTIITKFKICRDKKDLLAALQTTN